MSGYQCAYFGSPIFVTRDVAHIARYDSQMMDNGGGVRLRPFIRLKQVETR
ncbi:MAG: hypothetical protein HYT87_19865 [Nitrospirae bacterium]|nr:hypothetical protein [Nitrospirota bacterium]